MAAFDFAVPGDIDAPTGGYVYARRCLAHGAGRLRHLPLTGAFPDPSGAEMAAALTALTGAGPVLVDGLALCALPRDALLSLNRPIVALHHHPQGMEPGLPPRQARDWLRREGAALSACAAVIVTSRTTAKTLTSRLHVPEEWIRIAEPGLDRTDRAPRRGDPPLILSVGTICHRKGQDLLLSALENLADAPWRCRIIGAQDREPAFAAQIRGRIAASPLSDRIRLDPALPAKALDRAYGQADIFCLPSRYEGFGMVFAEAMMRGLPIVALKTGAAPEVIPDAAGLLAPEDPAALADMLGVMLSFPPVRDRMSDAALAHARSFPTWADTTRTILRTLEAL